ncbi:MaoC/PaaZ C-terminal domain-containing protein [Xanthobacter sediminis]
MTIDYAALRNRSFPQRAHRYGPRDCILYALGVGAGMDPADAGALAYVHEKELKALPTMAVVLGYAGFWLREPGTGLDWKTVLHVDEELVLHRALDISGAVVGQTRIAEIYDRGIAGGVPRGALMVTRRDIRDADTGMPLATVTQTELCRGEGGFGGPPPPARPAAAMPERAPDAHLSLPTSPQAALIYRLSGDDNALHVDPEVARQAGFERPILHGLSTFGMAGRAVLAALCGNAPERLRALRMRFTAPVLPGQTLRFELWRVGAGRGAFRAFAAETGHVVLDGGEAQFDAD